MASIFRFPSYSASAASPSSGDNVLAATAVVSTSPTLATELPLQALVKASSAQVIVSSPLRAVSLPVWAVSLPTRAIASVSRRSGCKGS